MIEKPLIIIIVCYIASFTFLGVQVTLGDVIDIDMRVFDETTGGFTGEKIGGATGAIKTMTDVAEFCLDSSGALIGTASNPTYTTESACTTANSTNVWTIGNGASYSQLTEDTYQMRLTMTDQPSVVNNPIAAAANIAYLLFGIITGTYIFNILTFMGVPIEFVGGIIMIYIIMLARTVIALLRGI